MHTHTRSLAAAMLVALLALPAGADAPRLIGDHTVSYDPQDFHRYFHGRDGRVVVVGDPFGLGAEAFAKSVIALMPRQHRGATTNFVATSPADSANSPRIVLAFNTRPRIDICADGNFVPAAGGGPIRLDAAWCPGFSAYSYVTGYLGSATGVADPGFRELIVQSMLELFPSHNIHIRTEPDNGD